MKSDIFDVIVMGGCLVVVYLYYLIIIFKEDVLKWGKEV